MLLIVLCACAVEDPQTPEFAALQSACAEGDTTACFQVEQIRLELQRQQNEMLFGSDTVIVNGF
ncbi:MAG: hypothetical protein AAFN09_02520 [Pseudomonadota bacterium]